MNKQAKKNIDKKHRLSDRQFVDIRAADYTHNQI